MSDNKYDSVLIGYCEEPRYYDESLSSWSVKFKASELQEAIEKYATPVNDKGEGGNLFFKLFISKNGKPCCSVYDYNSETAKTKRAEKQAEKEAVSDGMPF